jgi:hypothetical protein
LKQNCCKENYDDGYIRKERRGGMCVKAGILKLSGVGSGFGRGRCPLCLEEEDAKHTVLLKFLK